MQGHALVGRHKQDGAPPQRDVRESGGAGCRGVAFDDQEDAGAVDGSHSVLLPRGRDLQDETESPSNHDATQQIPFITFKVSFGDFWTLFVIILPRISDLINASNSKR